MLKLNDLVPLNLLSEKEKFFQSGFKYNPQFIYDVEINPTDLLKHGKPRFWHLFMAKKIFRKYLKNIEQFEADLKENNFLNKEDIQNIIEERLKFYNLKDSYEISFSNDYMSRISVKNESKIIKIKLPVIISKDEIEETLAHEIDTHAVRQLNYEKQIWYRKKKKHGFVSYLRTEEGLAAINELVSSKHKLAYKSAANYLSIDLALKNDFITVFNFFYNFSHDAERSWIWAVKKKRGIKDTSQKGAFTKDVVYFEGFLEVLNYLLRKKGNPSKLYFGKISLKDINKAEKIGVTKEIFLPQIFTNDPKQYQKAIYQIAKNNLL